MKMRLFSGLMLVLLLGPDLGSARADFLPGSPAGQDPFIIKFDEYCNNMVSQNGGPFHSVFCGLLPDPLNNFTLVPTFILPEFVNTGDLLVLDPDKSIGDLLRFPDLGTGITNLMMYYSDKEVDDAPSDVGIPSSFQFIIAVVPETGPEGNNGFVYVAGSPPFANTYVGTSDSVVPAPASLVLFASGGGLLGLTAWVRGRRRIAQRPGIG